MSKVLHTHPVRVYYEDTDAGGIVFYANYLRFAERARTEMLRAWGFNQVRIAEEQDVLFAVRKCCADYRRPARFDDMLAVETGVVEMGRSSIQVEQTVRRGDETLVVLEVTLVCISRAGKPKRIPIEVRTTCEHLLKDHASD